MSDAEHTRGQVYPIRGGKDGTLPPDGLPRRLAAIVAADIAGYSRLMGRDEEGTHARIKRHRRELIEPSIAEHHGKLIKYTGDGFLAMFDSPRLFGALSSFNKVWWGAMLRFRWNKGFSTESVFILVT